METTISKRSTPEGMELDAKMRELAFLEDQVADRELEVATTRAKLHHFEDKYLREVGVYLAELDELKARAVETLAKESPDDGAVQAEAEEARQQANESYKATENLGEEEPSDKSFEPSDEFKKLYRAAARKFHPDATTDETERSERKKIMAEINRLYEKGKEEELRAFVDKCTNRPDVVEGEGIAFDLIRAIRKIAQLRERLAAIENELCKLVEGNWFELFKQVEEASEEGRDLLKEMQVSLTAEIEEMKEQLASL